MDNCIFCNIVNKKMKSWTIWEDESHIAFLTPFPNTKGFTVVIPKKHYSSYGFQVEDRVLTELVIAAKKVGLLLDQRLGVKRTALMMEGFGVDHLHIKLSPMHGIDQKEWRPIVSESKTFYDSYPGYIASNDGPKMDDQVLDEICRLIKG